MVRKAQRVFGEIAITGKDRVGLCPPQQAKRFSSARLNSNPN
jgi:hypothetical protein